MLPFSSITKGEKGEELVDFKAMKEAGAIAFSDGGIPVVNSKVMREGMIKANEVGSFTSAHCEEKSVAKEKNNSKNDRNDYLCRKTVAESFFG